jgi:hypothetical protein
MNKLGGGGICEYCHGWDSNISLHTSNMCLSNPDSWASKAAADETKEAERKKALPPPGLKLYCNSCKMQLTVPGAILFSPPFEADVFRYLVEDSMTVKKYHLCHGCYRIALKALDIEQYRTPSVVDLNKRR